MHPLVGEHTLIHKKQEGPPNIKTSAQVLAIIHMIMCVHVCHNDLSPEFCFDVYCLDKNLCVLETSLVSVFSQNKRASAHLLI